MNSRGYPSMTALLGLLAIAGYQNRDKIAEMLRGAGKSAPATAGQSGTETPGQSTTGGLTGFFDQLKSKLGGTGPGGLLSGGLNEIVDRFKQSGQGHL